MNKKIYCTLDTETYGGATNPKGIYHCAGIIHDREGNIISSFNYLVAENYDEIAKDDYAKKNFDRYRLMVENGGVTAIPTEDKCIEMVNALLGMYDVHYVMAFNSGFDFCKTKCRNLLEGREFIDIWLMALQTIAPIKKYADFCRANGLKSSTGKSCATSAESFYAYLTGNADYSEEHTAFEDSKIEMQIFLAALKTHKHYTKNVHCFDYIGKDKVFPKWKPTIRKYKTKKQTKAKA